MVLGDFPTWFNGFISGREPRNSRLFEVTQLFTSGFPTTCPNQCRILQMRFNNTARGDSSFDLLLTRSNQRQFVPKRIWVKQRTTEADKAVRIPQYYHSLSTQNCRFLFNFASWGSPEKNADCKTGRLNERLRKRLRAKFLQPISTDSYPPFYHRYLLGRAPRHYFKRLSTD